MVSRAIIDVLCGQVLLTHRSFLELGLQLYVELLHFLPEVFIVVVFPLSRQRILFSLLFRFVLPHSIEVFHPFGLLCIMLLFSLLQSFDLVIEFAHVLLPIDMVLGHPMQILERALLHLRSLRHVVKDCHVQHLSILI